MPTTEFFGHGKSRADCEVLALARVSDTLRLREADLMSTKWFDYRFVHPIISTYYYAECYSQALRDFCSLTTDVQQSKTARAFPHQDIFQTRDAMSCVSARQALDQIGCRYSWALSFIVNRYADRGWRAMPRPNQIYSEELTLDIRDAWVIECAASLQIPKSTKFLVAKHVAAPSYVNDYTRWVFKQVRARGSNHWMPLSRLLKEGVVSHDAVRAEFGSAQLERALRAAGLL